MTDTESAKIWRQIVEILDEKLQYGFLNQEKSVVDISINGNELTLYVCNDEAFDFFQSEINQQRLMIMSRGIRNFNSIIVAKVEADSIEL